MHPGFNLLELEIGHRITRIYSPTKSLGAPLRIHIHMSCPGEHAASVYHLCLFPLYVTDPSFFHTSEIDVWPSSAGPIVTHGHTFSQSIPFAAVCNTIGSFVKSNPDSWPVLVSLECHVYGEQEQQELVRIMREAWGERFVDGRLEDLEEGRALTPEMVMGKVLVMVSIG